MVVIFSWFHTNQLGVGLHSYGFNSGLAKLIWSFYWLQIGVLGFGALGTVVHRTLEQSKQRADAEAGLGVDPVDGKAGEPA